MQNPSAEINAVKRVSVATNSSFENGSKPSALSPTVFGYVNLGVISIF